MGALGFSAKAGLGFLLFVAGYSFCRYVNNDHQYSIIRRDGKPYLYDHNHDRDLPLLEKEFQMGSLEYRLEGILHDRRLPAVLHKLSLEEEDSKR